MRGGLQELVRFFCGGEPAAVEFGRQEIGGSDASEREGRGDLRVAAPGSDVVERSRGVSSWKRFSG